MSADGPAWQVQGAGSWKISLPCSRAEAERIARSDELPDDPFDDLAQPPVLMTSEPDEDRPDAWRLDAYVEAEPDAALVARIRALVPSADGIAPEIAAIEDADWVTISQAWLEPIRAGRFFVHTAAHAAAVPPDVTAFRVEAGRAFGTGHHETTTGCLLMLDRLATQGARFADVADIGTGTGLLALAARALWPEARVAGSDIDPVAIDVAREVARANAVPDGAVAWIVADGMAAPSLVARAPYDLLIANILAGPLIDLAPAFAAALAPGGSILLAGLLADQADAVIAAYAACGLAPADRIDRGHWPTLRLAKG